MMAKIEPSTSDLEDSLNLSALDESIINESNNNNIEENKQQIEDEEDKGAKIYTIIKYITRMSGLYLPSLRDDKDQNLCYVACVLVCWLVGVLLLVQVYLFGHSFYDTLYNDENSKLTYLIVTLYLVRGLTVVAGAIMFLMFCFNGGKAAGMLKAMKSLRRETAIPTWGSAENEFTNWVYRGGISHIVILAATITAMCLKFYYHRTDLSIGSRYFSYQLLIFTDTVKESPWYEVTVTVQAITVFFLLFSMHMIEFWIGFTAKFLTAYIANLQTFVRFLTRGSCPVEDTTERRIIRDIDEILSKESKNFGAPEMVDNVATYLDNLKEEDKQKLFQMKVPPTEAEVCCPWHNNVGYNIESVMYAQEDLMHLMKLAQKTLHHYPTLIILVSIVTGCLYMDILMYEDCTGGICNYLVDWSIADTVFIIALLLRATIVIIACGGLKQRRGMMSSCVPAGSWTKHPDTKFKLSMILKSDDQPMGITASYCCLISKPLAWMVWIVPSVYGIFLCEMNRVSEATAKPEP